MKKIFTIYFHDGTDEEPKRFEVIVGKTMLQRQVIGMDGGDPILEVAIVDATSKEIMYAYGVPTDRVRYYEFTTEDDRVINEKVTLADEVSERPL